MRMKTTKIVVERRTPSGRRAEPKCHVCGQAHTPDDDDVHPPPTLTLPAVFVGRVTRFSSGSSVQSGLRALSNFHTTRVSVCIDGTTTRHFPSSEHAYVFHSVVPNEQLCEGGALSTFAGLLVVQDQLAKSTEAIADYWTDDRIGIVAKLVGNCARKARGQATMDIEQKRSLWLTILRSKFRDPATRRVLLGTGDSYLVEYAKGAVRRQRIGLAPERWGGWDYTPDDRPVVHIWGDNHMGRLLMTVRDEIRAEIHAGNTTGERGRPDDWSG